MCIGRRMKASEYKKIQKRIVIGVTLLRDKVTEHLRRAGSQMQYAMNGERCGCENHIIIIIHVVADCAHKHS